jgi:hypothetical protein
MTGKSEAVLKKHSFIEKSNNSTQSTDHTWTVNGPRRMTGNSVSEIQSQGPLNLCCSVNNQFPNNN